MKGYDTSNGYMGYVEGKYILFASEQEYFEFIDSALDMDIRLSVTRRNWWVKDIIRIQKMDWMHA